MTEIADFLRARYQEQRAIAEAAAEHAGTGDWRYQPGSDYVAAVQTFPDDMPARRELWTPLVTEAGSYIGDTLDDEIGSHIAAHDPAAVIADLDAKLEIVSDYERCEDDTASATPNEHTGWADALECVVATLALPFAGHPDYREEWKS
ncbi:DUF6221 family protein [Streptomyces sp. NPDC004376]